MKKSNDKSSMSTHNLMTGHTFYRDYVKVVHMVPRKDWHNVTAVTIQIRLRNADINWKEGYDLAPIYMPLLREKRALHAVKPVLSWDENFVFLFPAFPVSETLEGI